nr:MAG TPA: hypothetical protein [Bacteriophage sp.]
MREHSLFLFPILSSSFQIGKNHYRNHLSLFYPQPYQSWNHDSPMMVYT